MLRADFDTTILSKSPAAENLDKTLKDANAQRQHAARLAEEQRKLKAAKKRAFRAPTPAQLEFLQSRHAKKLARKEILRQRYERGYVFAGGAVGNLHQDAFVFQGLKSADHPLLQAFVAMLPRRDRLQSGMTKEILDGEGDSKIMALDLAYVEGNKKVMGFIRLDIDAIFSSWGHLSDLIHDLGVPLPHIGVGGRMDDGRIRNPHLIWLLPLGNGIRTGQGALRAPTALYRAVGRGLCKALLSIGADPGGLSNQMRVKNPLSPHWSTCILNDAMPMSLSDLASWVDIQVKASALTQAYVELTAERDGIPAVESNRAFIAFRQAAFETLKGWYRSGDSRMLLTDREDLAISLTFALRRQARAALSCGRKPRQAMAILQRVCRFAAEHFDPDKVASQRVNAGILKEELTGIRTLRGRQQAGAAYTAKTKRERTMKILADYIAKHPEATKAQVARDLGLSRDTVYRLWYEAVE